MAISDALKDEKAPAVAEPKQTAVPKKKSDVFKQKGAAERKKLSADQLAAEGAKSATVTFKGCLGNPAKAQSRVQGGKSINSLTVVGYEFVSTEDVTVNIYPIKEGFKSLTDVDYKSGITKTFKAGETIALNAIEMVDFISRNEYAGKFSGEGKEVTLSAKFSNDRPDPLPILKAAEGSIKEVMIPVADKVDGKMVVKEEYAEKFAVLFVRKKAQRGGSSNTAQPGEAEKNMAASFRMFLEQKKSEA